MKSYRFRLETLRRLRSAQRDQHRVALADAYRAEQILAERRAEVTAEQVELHQLKQAAVSARYLDVNQLLEVQRYESVLKAREDQLKAQAKRLAIETERRRLAVVEADRAVRVLDLLDERKRREHRKQQTRWETKEMDEVAMTRRPLA
jgi:flagellar export protein FliJ